MKVLPNSTSEMISSYEEIMIAIMNQVDITTSNYDYLLPRGWRFILELDIAGADVMCLDLQSDKGGGSFAGVKMKTLTDFTSNKPATGIDKISYIKELIEANGLAKSELGTEICEMMDAKHLTRIHHEWLKDKIGYTNFYGAIQVPYTRASLFPAITEDAVIRLAFSGASEEQDVMFAVWVLQEFQKSLVDTIKGSHFTFDLEAFKTIPNVQMWFDLLDIRRLPRS